MHSAQKPLPAPSQGRISFPANILGEDARSVEPGTPPQMTQRRKPPNRVPAEQVPARPTDLRAPDDRAES